MLKLMRILPADFNRAKVILEMSLSDPAGVVVGCLVLHLSYTANLPFLLRSQVCPCPKASSGLHFLYVHDYFLSSKDYL